MYRPFPSYAGNEPFLFVCYAHDDKALVYPELVRLRDAGFNIWYDEGISPGSEWSENIARHIERCASFLYFVTPHSVASANCRREVSFALDQSCQVLAIHLQETALPSGLRLQLNNLQAIYRYADEVTSYEAKLIQALGGVAPKQPDTLASNESEAAPDIDRPDPFPHVQADRVPVAVIPFQMRSGNSEDQYLSVALAEAVIHRLSSIGKLVVRPVSSVLRYKDQDADRMHIGRDLNVEIVVQGVVHISAGRARVLVEASRVADAKTLHASKHDGELDDLFGLQDRITDSISGAFAPRSDTVAAPATPPTKHPQAYELYLRAADRIAHWNRSDLEIAIDTLRQVLDLDPNFADAWGRLAQALTGMGQHFDPDPKWIEEAENAIERTLMLDPVHCDALCARSMILWMPSHGFQHRPALRAINASLKINPQRDVARQFRGAVLFHLGFYEQAARDLQEALLTNPGYTLAITTNATIATYRGDYEAAHDLYQRALALNPVGLHANLFSASPAIYLGRLGEARDAIRRVRQMLPDEPQLDALESRVLACEGAYRDAEGLADRAVQNPRSLTHTHHAWHDAAGVYAMCGKPDKAILQLRRCAEMGLPNYALFQSDPPLHSLHGHPDFQTLMTELRRERDRFSEEFGFT